MADTVLDAALIMAAARAPGGPAAFPFLKPFGRAPVPGCCGQGAAAADPRTAIAAVARLEPGRLAAFKALVGAATLVAWTVRNGRQVKLTL